MLDIGCWMLDTGCRILRVWRVARCAGSWMHQPAQAAHHNFLRQMCHPALVGAKMKWP